MFLNLRITTCRLIVSCLFVQDMFVEVAGIIFHIHSNENPTWQWHYGMINTLPDLQLEFL